ncbi:glycosyl transferase [Catellatospora sp. TT07R-123]|nr:glycosyl transferase [Catellatospora sp. TT07R-123]
MVAGALAVTWNLVRDVPGTMNVNFGDQNQFEFFLAHGAAVLRDGRNPLFTTAMNFPDGVNAMGNTSVLGLSLPLSPLTIAIGPHATFLVLLGLMFALTGLAWYALLSRAVVASPAAALTGAAWCAFAPGMVSHGNAHPNIVGQFLVPLIVWQVLRAAARRRPWRDGAVLAALVVWQAFINEEILLFTAVALGLFTGTAALVRPDLRRRVRPLLAALAVAAPLAAAVLAYPLWWQFTGPQSYHGLGEHIPTYGNDLGSLLTYSTQSLASAVLPDALAGPAPAPNQTEETVYFGLPLMLLLVWLGWRLRRDRTVVVLAAVGTVFAVLSLGTAVSWWDRPLLAGPWQTLARLPILDSVVPARLALVTVAVVGVLLALGADRAARGGLRRPAAVALVMAYAAALLPALPTPLEVAPRVPAPAVLTNGVLGAYVGPGHGIMFIPPTRVTVPEPMGWLAESGLRYHMTSGYFLGPGGTDGRGASTPPARFFDTWLYEIRRTGYVPPITAQQRAQAVADLRYWQVDALVLGQTKRPGRLRWAVTRLLGVTPQYSGGADWVWDVRELVWGRVPDLG